MKKVFVVLLMVIVLMALMAPAVSAAEVDTVIGPITMGVDQHTSIIRQNGFSIWGATSNNGMIVASWGNVRNDFGWHRMPWPDWPVSVMAYGSSQGMRMLYDEQRSLPVFTMQWRFPLDGLLVPGEVYHASFDRIFATAPRYFAPPPASGPLLWSGAAFTLSIVDSTLNELYARRLLMFAGDYWPLTTNPNSSEYRPPPTGTFAGSTTPANSPEDNAVFDTSTYEDENLGMHFPMPDVEGLEFVLTVQLVAWSSHRQYCLRYWRDVLSDEMSAAGATGERRASAPPVARHHSADWDDEV